MSDRLRTALRDAADVPAPAFSPGLAITGGRRRRRRRLTALAAGAAAVAAVAVAVPAVALRPAPTEPAGGGGGLTVAGYAFAVPRIVERSNLGDYRVRDRASGAYVETRWRTAVPSPDGRLVAVTSWDMEKVGIVAADRVLDDDAVRWIPGGLDGGYPAISTVWSPDGNFVLLDAVFTATSAGTVHRVLLADARTLETRTVVLRSGPQVWPTGMGKIVFGPGGEGFAVAIGLGEGAAPEDGMLVLYGADGRELRRLRTGPATVPDQPFSPDGGSVLVQTTDAFYGGSTRVLTLATGAEVARSDGDPVGWLDDGRYVVRSGPSAQVVELGSGRVLGGQRLAPDGSHLTGVWFVS